MLDGSNSSAEVWVEGWVRRGCNTSTQGVGTLLEQHDLLAKQQRHRSYFMKDTMNIDS